MEDYQVLIKFLINNTWIIKSILEINSKNQEQEIASSLTCLFDFYGKLDLLKKETLNLINQDDVSSISNFLRGNSIKITIISQCLKLYGYDYIINILKSISSLKNLSNGKISCVIDSNKLKLGDISSNLNNLTEITKNILNSIWKSYSEIPTFIKELIIELKKKLKTFSKKNEKENIDYLIISGTLFLRLLCPIIISLPIKNTREEIKKDIHNSLLTIAGLIQKISNLTILIEEGNFQNINKNFIQEQMIHFKKFSEIILNKSQTFSNNKDISKKFREKIHQKLSTSIIFLYDFLNKNSYEIEEYIKKNFSISHLKNFQLSIDHTRASLHGTDPTQAEDYKKVWERIQRRLNVNPNIIISSNSSSESNEDSEELIEYQESFSEDSEWEFESNLSPSSSFGNLSKLATTKFIIKCFFEQEKKLCLLSFNGSISFTQFLIMVQQKFNFPKEKSLKLKYFKDEVSKQKYILLDDESSFQQFLQQSNDSNINCLTYKIWVE